MMPKMNTPMITPLIFPLPPVKLVPPTTTAAIQSFARSSPLVGAPTPSRAVKRIPAIPAQTAQKMYGAIFHLDTLIPESLTASSFPPMA